MSRERKDRILITGNKHNGRYVALKGFNDGTVVSRGESPQEVYDWAVKKGCEKPVIVFVPVKNRTHIYPHTYA